MDALQVLGNIIPEKIYIEFHLHNIIQFYTLISINNIIGDDILRIQFIIYNTKYRKDKIYYGSRILCDMP